MAKPLVRQKAPSESLAVRVLVIGSNWVEDSVDVGGLGPKLQLSSTQTRWQRAMLFHDTHRPSCKDNGLHSRLDWTLEKYSPPWGIERNRLECEK